MTGGSREIVEGNVAENRSSCRQRASRKKQLFSICCVSLQGDEAREAEREREGDGKNRDRKAEGGREIGMGRFLSSTNYSFIKTLQ